MIPLPTLDALDAVTIPVPCTVPWDEMSGDCRTRFCDQCRQNVYDVSELSRAEAVELLTATAGVPCLRIYRRPDGRVMTADCATRRERVWKWLDRRSKWAAGLFALAFFAGCDRVSWSTVGRPCYLPTPEHVVEGAARSITEGVMRGTVVNRNRIGK